MMPHIQNWYLDIRMNTYLQKKHQLHPLISKKISYNAKTAMLFFKHHFYLLIGKEKYSCNSSRSIWRPKNNSYTTGTLSQKHVTSHLFHLRCISHCVYTNYLFLYFPYILVDKVVVSAILFDQKKLTDQMLYDASILQEKKDV